MRKKLTKFCGIRSWQMMFMMFCKICFLCIAVMMSILYLYSNYYIPLHLKRLKMTKLRNKGQEIQPGKLLQPSTQQNNDGLSYYDTNMLKDNVIYKRFNIDAPRYKKRVGIVVIVQSAPREFERRQSIRNTWFQNCENTKNVKNFP